MTLLAFATAASASREVLALLVRGAVGDGPGLELLAHLDRMDLPDPKHCWPIRPPPSCRNGATCVRPR
ncbi:hypothetical protein GCM10017687_44270 [Streptomyces echinatus]